MEHLKRAPWLYLYFWQSCCLERRAFGRLILSGMELQFHEDQPERRRTRCWRHSGLPINEAARAMADAWKADILAVRNTM